MKKELIVHVGAGKCGSSAIQAFLAKNIEVLKEQGILIPGEKLDLDSKCTGNQIWFFQNGVSNPNFKQAVERRLKRLHSHMLEKDYDQLIVSAENLINPDGFPVLFTDLKALFDIKIVAYVRRQDDYLISAWQQWYLKYFESFEEYVNAMGSRVDWFQALEGWCKEFGKDSMSVRVFERDKLVNGNAIDDFAQITSIDMSRTEPVREKINRSLDEKFNNVDNKYRSELFDSIHDNQFYQFLADIYGEAAFKHYQGSSQLSLAQRLLLCDRYSESNKKLREQYLDPSQIPSGVFKAPSELDCVDSRDARFDDEMHDYTLVGMFGLYKRMNKKIMSLEEKISKIELNEEIA